METIQQSPITLKLVFQENWNTFLAVHQTLVTWSIVYNVWKISNCRKPAGFSFSTFACLFHPYEIRHVPHSCKSQFFSVCAKVQIDQLVADMNRLFPNCSYFHITFTVPSQFRALLLKNRSCSMPLFSPALKR